MSNTVGLIFATIICLISGGYGMVVMGKQANLELKITKGEVFVVSGKNYVAVEQK